MAAQDAVGTSERPLRVAVIGSGPSGFYAAAALLKQDRFSVEVDLFDRLPTPYGLVRGGVAPDHPKIKSVTRIFDKSAMLPGFAFMGNVELGRDILAEDLTRHYHQIIYAVGNEDDRRMGIPGEFLFGCTPASVFVGWYNAHPDYRDARFDFSCKRIIVVGNGNVAIDVARILAKNNEELAATDIANHALRTLEGSCVEEVVVLGRRGPVQAAFTPGELKELMGLSHASVRVEAADLELDEWSRLQLDAAGERSPASRIHEMLSCVTGPDEPGKRRICLRFLASPVEILGDAQGRVRGVRLERNRLVRDERDVLRSHGTGQFEELEAGWVFSSIGYQGRRTPGVPFDEKRRVIANDDGRVVDPATGEVVPNQYVVGWAKSGPRGLIGTHKAGSAAVARHMLEDVLAGQVADRRPSRAAVVDLLEQRGVEYVTYEDWKRIDAAEVERGKRRDAPRSKFSRVSDMMDVVRDDPSAQD